MMIVCVSCHLSRAAAASVPLAPDEDLVMLMSYTAADLGTEDEDAADASQTGLRYGGAG